MPKINFETVNNEIKPIENTSLDLENLTKEYSNLLIQYQQAVTDYNNYIQTQTSSQTQNQSFNKNFITVENQSFWGSSSISQTNSSTLQECQALCSSNTDCTGATYNNDTQICYLRGGNGQTIPSESGDIAIVPEVVQLLSNMEQINKQLITVNQQILETIEIGTKQYNKLENETSDITTKTLLKNYSNLVKERKNIAAMIHEHSSLNEVQEIGSLTVNKNYYSFLLLGFLVIIVIFILYKTSSPQVIQKGGELGNNCYYFIYFMVFFIGIIYLYNYVKKLYT